MADGVISERAAHALVDPTEDYGEELARVAVVKTLETAEGRSPQQLRRSVQGRLQRADPAEHHTMGQSYTTTPEPVDEPPF